MRTAIAAGFAALVVIAAAVFGWQAVSDRLAPDDASPDVPIDALLTELSEGPGGNVEATVRSGAPELTAAVQAFADGLEVSDWSAERGPIELDGATATTPVTITLATATFGDVSWETSLEATRVRGQWGLDVTGATFHPDWREGRQVVVERTDVTRAPILDRDDQPLTLHGTARSIGVVPGRIVNEERLLEAWSATLPESLEDLQDTLARGDLQQDWYYPLVTVAADRYDDVWPQLRVVPGVISREADEATPTADTFASHVIGRVGRPTAEQAADLGVPADQSVGLNGLERVFEDQLVGSAEARALLVDPDGDEVAELATAQDDPSGPVGTTLDRVVQEAVENALSSISSNAAVVVVDATDGAIRATASRPLSGYNRAWEGNYPPGDAFLPVPAEALLAGDVVLGDAIELPGPRGRRRRRVRRPATARRHHRGAGPGRRVRPVAGCPGCRAPRRGRAGRRRRALRVRHVAGPAAAVGHRRPARARRRHRARPGRRRAGARAGLAPARRQHPRRGG